MNEPPNVFGLGGQDLKLPGLETVVSAASVAFFVWRDSLIANKCALNLDISIIGPMPANNNYYTAGNIISYVDLSLCCDL